MVAYGAKLQQARRPGWEEAYLEYAKLKQSLLEGDLEAAVLDADDEEQRAGSSSRNLLANRSSSISSSRTIEAARRRFLGALETEIEKVSLFTLSRQGELADAVGAYRFADLQDTIPDDRRPGASGSTTTGGVSLRLVAQSHYETIRRTSQALAVLSKNVVKRWCGVGSSIQQRCCC